MIPELGHFLLILGAAAALLAPAAVFAGLKTGSVFYRDVWRPSLFISTAAFLGATAMLVWCFITSDFSVQYVANHSNTKLDTVYKIAALWGSHEGSMLLWVLLMTVGTAWTALMKCDDGVYMARLQGLMLAVIAGFSIFLLLTSNPFLRNLPMVPPEGRDLNPVLQDIGMILHPPVLFMGYSGLAVMFAAMSALLMSGKWTDAAVRLVTKVSYVTWGLLTAGNMLGSWWAYNELGWGGWWFWDPVENASFIPWLTTTALIHALIQTRRRSQLRRLSIFLTMVGFGLCLFGTWLVRSGAMQSVHAFASDPTRGIALQLLAIVLLVPAAVLYVMRIERVCTEPEKPAVLFDGLMISGIYLLVIAAFCVLFGTIYPLIYEIFAGTTLTVGAPYFNSFFAPMAIVAALLAGAAHLGASRLRWAVSAVVSAAAAGIVLAFTSPRDVLMTGAAVFAAAWILSAVVSGFLPGQKRFSPAAVLSHVGIAVSIIGAVGVQQYESEALVRMGPGLGKPVGDVVFVYTETRFVSNHSYYGQQGVIEVLNADDEKLIAVLRPERQTFNANGMQMSAAGIRHGVMRDLYVSMGNKLSDEEWLVRLSIKPLASWIWAGGVLMILGAFAALFRRRKKEIR
ncbi:MAG: heme lyase NrfEFG subunit NrfE [Sutterella sp.]|nr:heme lyase NrfEFG subunit NrfE [Sutterella sp.]